MGTKKVTYKVGQRVWVQPREQAFSKWLGEVEMVLNMPGKYAVKDANGYLDVIDESQLIKPLVKAKTKARTKKKAARKSIRPARAKRTVMKLGARGR